MAMTVSDKTAYEIYKDLIKAVEPANVPPVVGPKTLKKPIFLDAVWGPPMSNGPMMEYLESKKVPAPSLPDPDHDNTPTPAAAEEAPVDVDMTHLKEMRDLMIQILHGKKDLSDSYSLISDHYHYLRKTISLMEEVDV